MLDPTKEITAEQMMCENGFSSRSDSAIRLNGSEFFKNIQSLKTENQGLKEVSITTPQTQELIQEDNKQDIGGDSEA